MLMCSEMGTRITKESIRTPQQEDLEGNIFGDGFTFHSRTTNHEPLHLSHGFWGSAQFATKVIICCQLKRGIISGGLKWCSVNY